MKNRFLKIAVAACAAMAALAGAAAAASPIIDKAKSECVVGEQTDGYLGIIDPGRASAELRREVDSINMQRKAIYVRLAERNGVTIEDAAALTAEKLINGAPSGHCVRAANGSWRKKP